MGDDLKRVGLVFKADGAVDFTKSIKEVNASIEENKAAFELAKSQWDENTKAADKLSDRQKYLSEQTKDYSDKVKLLQRDLEEIENREKSYSEKINKKREQLETVSKVTEGYQKKCIDLKSELEQLEAEENANEAAIEKKRKQLERAEKGFVDYSAKIEKIEADIEKLNKGEANNVAAIQKKKAQLEKTQASLNNYKKGLSEVEEELKSGSYKIKEYTDNLKDFQEKAEGVGDKLSGISTAAAGVLAAATATVPATEEYRKIMASLKSSSELAGYTAEQTAETYRTLFGVLSDDQSAATTTANLQALGLSQEQLQEITNGTIGAWAKYGDSIPIDGLAEAINETVKVGSVTGTFADVLNWAGTSEDKFNEKLEACNTESERANLIMQELANQGLTQAGEKWQANNKELVESNQATANLQEETAELAETVAPLITEVTELMAGLLGKFNDMPESVQMTIGVVLALVAASSTLFGTIGKVSGGIGDLILFMGKASEGARTLWGIMSAHPIGAIITVVGLLITTFVTLYNKCEWFRDGVNEIWGGMKTFLNGVKDWLVDLFDFEWKLPDIKLPHFNVSGEFSFGPPMTVPSIGIEWYENGGILNSPTAFGMNGSNLMIGGEVEPEAVLPISLLKQYIREENQINNGVLAQAIAEILAGMNIVAENNIYLGNEKLVTLLTNMVIEKISGNMAAYSLAKGMSL